MDIPEISLDQKRRVRRYVIKLGRRYGFLAKELDELVAEFCETPDGLTYLGLTGNEPNTNIAKMEDTAYFKMQGLTYEQIGEIIGLTKESCRQLFSRLLYLLAKRKKSHDSKR